MEVSIKIFRYNPEKDKKPSYKTYKLEGIETDRVLDLLEKVKGFSPIRSEKDRIPSLF